MQKKSFNFGNLFFSEIFRNSSRAKKIASIAVFAALSVMTNMFLEVKIFDLQFSLTIFVSTIIGVILGPIAGFITCVFGDFIGYVSNSWGLIYMPWVGISTGLFAFLAGIILGGVFNAKEEITYGKMFARLAVFAAVSFVVCTIAVNSTGFSRLRQEFRRVRREEFRRKLRVFRLCVIQIVLFGTDMEQRCQLRASFRLLPCAETRSFASDGGLILSVEIEHSENVE